MERAIGLIGIGVLIGFAWLMSEHKRRFPFRLVLSGVALQFMLGVLLLKTPGVVDVFGYLAAFVNGVISRADAGIEFIFGPNLTDPSGPWGFVFAIRVLPVIIFFASLTAVLYHIGVMQRLVAGLAWLLRRTLGVTGTEALAMASNVFVGQTEAPLCIKPYLERMTRAQLTTLMVGGFATIAGSVLAAYVGILGGTDDALRVVYIKHLLAASVMSAPAAFVISRVIVPETEQPFDEGLHAVGEDDKATNVLDAAAAGATDGLHLALNVGGMLIAFVALLALINWPIEAIGDWGPIHDWLVRHRVLAGSETLNLQTILGALFMPLAWTMGIPWADAGPFGSLLGQKLIVTEFFAYLSLGEMINDPSGAQLSERSAQIAAYALCGFANFASIAIQIGGLTSLAPGQRKNFVTLGFKAMFGGAFASWMTACVAGVLL